MAYAYDAPEDFKEFSEKVLELGERKNEGKTEWSLVDFTSVEPLAKVLMFGAKKYAPNNWRKGLPYTKVIESLLRHVFKVLNGEVVDEESGIEHTGHIMCNAMFLEWMMKNRPDLDDRYKK